MTAPDLCHLASIAIPGVTFHPIDFGRGMVSARSHSARVTHRPDVDGYTVTVRGNGADYQGAGDTIADAHRDALECRDQHERTRAFADPQTQGLLDL